MIGIADIDLIQGNTAVVRFTFEELLTTGLTPLNLNRFNAIRLNVKKEPLVDSPILLALALNAGLQIVGDDSNILEITFTRPFMDIDSVTLFYDILFVDGVLFDTLLGNKINLTRVVTI